MTSEINYIKYKDSKNTRKKRSNIKTFKLPVNNRKFKRGIKKIIKKETIVIVLDIKNKEDLENILKNLNIKLHQNIIICVDAEKLKDKVDAEKLKDEAKNNLIKECLDYCKIIKNEGYKAGVFQTINFYISELKNIHYDNITKKYELNQNDKITKNSYILCIEETNSNIKINNKKCLKKIIYPIVKKIKNIFYEIYNIIKNLKEIICIIPYILNIKLFIIILFIIILIILAIYFIFKFFKK